MRYRNAGKNEAERDFIVHWENWEAVNIFLDMCTQWRVIAGFGGAVYQGLEYASLIALINLKCENPTQTFDDVRIIELGAISELRKQNGQKSEKRYFDNR